MKTTYITIKTIKFFTITAFLAMFSTNTSSAQEVEKHLIYYSNEINIGNYFGYSGDVNYVYNEKFSAKIGFSGNLRKSPDQPSNYSPGLAGVLTFVMSMARDTIVDTHLQVGRIYYLNSKRNTRLNAAIGVAYTTIHTIENWQEGGNGTLSSNYTYDKVKTRTASLMISPKLEFPLGQVFGFTISPTAIINSESSYYGVGLGYVIGLVRSKPIRN